MPIARFCHRTVAVERAQRIDPIPDPFEDMMKFGLVNYLAFGSNQRRGEETNSDCGLRPSQ